MTRPAGIAYSFRGRIEGGNIIFERPQDFATAKRSFPEGSEIDVTLCTPSPNRSTDANRFYWGVVIKQMAAHFGYTNEEMHQALKRHLLVDRSDPGLPRVRSTASLTPEEFSRYVDDAIRVGAEYGCVISEAACP